jgi:hypothetical protein
MLPTLLFEVMRTDSHLDNLECLVLLELAACTCTHCSLSLSLSLAGVHE